ncbi:MAG: sel1 repeat family protein [Ruminococcus flavefaciens]|nr:sel1 repeat family protein [Ruminococcus flavefaciens]
MANSIINGDDLRYFVQQSPNQLTTIVGQMTTLLQDITDTQNDTNARVESMEKQSWFKRMWSTVSGKNKATKNEIQKNQDKIVSYVSQAVAQCYQMNCLDQQAIYSLGNRMNQIYAQVNDVYTEQLQMKSQLAEIQMIQQQTLQALGGFVFTLNEKIESVDNFHMLISEIQNGVYCDSSRLYSLCSVLSQLDKRQMEDNRKMSLLKDTMGKAEIITANEVTVLQCLQEIIALPEEKIGLIYLELCNFRNSFPANLFADMIESYHFLPKMEKMSKKKETIIQRVLDKYELDSNAEFSLADIVESFLENKQDLLVNIENVKMIDTNVVQGSNVYVSNAEIKEAEKLFMDYQISESLPLFHKLAESGNGRAMYILGEIYKNYYGGVESDDFDEDKKWTKKGADAGDILAKLNYGYNLYWSGEELDKADEIFSECFPLVKEMAENGDAIAQNELGDMYLNGTGTEKNETLGESWILKSAQQGYFRSEWTIADIYYNKKKNESQAFEFCKKSADKGYDEAYFLLGIFYNNGFGIKENQNMVEKCLRNAAQLGHTMAKAILGERLYDEEEYDEAFKWLSEFETAYSNSDVKYKLAMCYILGYGTYEDEGRAISILESILKDDDYENVVDIQEWLGILYEENKEYEKSFEWYMKAADNGSAVGQTNVGLAYRSGSGVRKNFAKAYDYFKKAAKGGNGEAMNQLGLMFDNGEHVQQNYCQAVRWYQKAVEQGFLPAKYNLALCYYYGTGVEEDEDYARYLLEELAEEGNESAQKFLDENF